MEDELSSRDQIRGLIAKLIDQQQAVTDIMVKLSDQYKLQEIYRTKDWSMKKLKPKTWNLCCDEASKRYISESTGDTMSTESHLLSKRSKLSHKEALAQGHAGRITKEGKQGQIKLINEQKELKIRALKSERTKNLKSERPQLYQVFENQGRILE